MLFWVNPRRALLSFITAFWCSLAIFGNFTSFRCKNLVIVAVNIIYNFISKTMDKTIMFTITVK